MVMAGRYIFAQYPFGTKLPIFASGVKQENYQHYFGKMFLGKSITYLLANTIYVYFYVRCTILFQFLIYINITHDSHFRL